ncbi:MAG: hypothetical protein IPI04_12810 [Ignavibacteria bacterium]|nr:hypothetical protein [Ignavibacteria bacterium]
MFNIKSILLFILLLVPGSRLLSQFDSHPELDWFTIETKHFFIHYHSGTERTANTAAKIAEDIYGPITSLYKFEPNEKVNFIINDVGYCKRCNRLRKLD